MAVNHEPIFVNTPVCGVGFSNTAETARTTPANATTLYTAPAEGGRVDYVRVMATGTTTAGIVRLWIHDGANYRLWKEIAVTAITPSGSVSAFEAEFVPTRPLVLPSGFSLRFSPVNAEGFNCFCHGGSFV
jgi:hypothetical protein